MLEQVILVNSQDREVGVEEKLEAHRQGNLHRAFSVFIVNKRGEWLLQKRAPSKYHSPSLWTNACCSHPRPLEILFEASQRRLQEEMGISCALTPLFSFIYCAPLDGGLTEHELDHVFVGQFEGEPNPNPAEVCAWKWVDFAPLEEDLLAHPDQYTAWFKLIAKRVYLSLPDQLSLVRSVEK